MKSKIESIIVGTGGHSRAVISLLNKKKNYIIRGIIETSAKVNYNEKILNYPVIGGIDDIENLLMKKSYNYFLAVGDNFIRKDIFDFLTKKKVNLPNLFDPHSFVDESVKLGYGNIFFIILM